MDDCIEFEPRPEMAVAARQFVRERLTTWEATEYVERAVIVTSELVTNAILHGRTRIVLRAEVNGDAVRIEVFDENPRPPVLASSAPEATSGRGLALVSELSSAWGVENRADGKVVWAEVGTVSRPRPDDCTEI